MPLDSNGIWQYEETDIVSPFSDFMNLGQSSVSTEIASLDGRVTSVETAAEDRSELFASSHAAVSAAFASSTWFNITGFNTAYPGTPSTTITDPALTDDQFSYASGIITPTIDVWFDIDLTVIWDSNGTGRRIIGIFMDGDDTATNPQVVDTVAASISARQSVHWSGPCEASHTLVLKMWQDSGANRTTVGRHLTIKATPMTIRTDI